MKITAFMLLLLPALNCAAQEKEHSAKHLTPVEQSIYSNERSQLTQYLKNPLFASIPNGFRTTTTTDADPIPGQDYFPAELFVNNEIRAKEYEAVAHDYHVQHFDDLQCTIDGRTYDHLRVDMITDRYALKGKPGVESDFRYNNTYFLFKDAAGNTLATVYYINRTVSVLQSEYRIVQKGSTPASGTLLITPNPAENRISIIYHLEEQSMGSLRIIDLNGRSVQTIQNSQLLEKGRQVKNHSINLPAGLYFIRLEIKGRPALTQKLIIK